MDREERVKVQRMILGYHAHHLLYILYIGLGATIARIRAYTVSGEVHKADYVTKKIAITLGRRILLICGVTGLSEENGVVSYRWFHSHTGKNKDRYQIHDRDPYYRVVKNTLLMDVTSWDQGGKYTCFVKLKRDAPSISSALILAVEG